MRIKALSLQQPYANLVTSGKKILETRTWITKHRGDILICASMSGIGEPKGVALCMVTIDYIRPMVETDIEDACVELYPRAQVWGLSNLRVLESPFPVKGQLSVFNLEISPELLRFKTDQSATNHDLSIARLTE
jgi:hypothetical protein